MPFNRRINKVVHKTSRTLLIQVRRKKERRKNIMNKLFTKIAALALGATMAVGVGVAVGAKSQTSPAEAAVGDEIKAVANIVSGTSYYIKGKRSNGTVEYLNFTDSSGNTVAGTGVSTTSSAKACTFTQTSGSWYITTPSGLYLTPAASNGKLILTSTATSVTLSDGSNTIKVKGASYYLQKNKSAANFGGYNNTQNDITLIVAAESKTLSSISLGGTYPTTFTIGDTFDHTGMTVTAHYSDSTTSNVTSSATWSNPDMSTSGTKQVTVSYGGKSATYNITVNAPVDPTNPTITGTATADKNGSWDFSNLTVTDGGSLGDITANCVLSSSDSTSTPGNTTITVHINYRNGQWEGNVSGVSATIRNVTNVTDTIDYDFTGITGSGYNAWSDKEGSSGAVYAGQSNAGVTYVQLRNQSPSGIVSTTSGGTPKSVSVKWGGSNTNNRVLTIYGKNTAYEATSELYDASTKGTEIGSITFTTGSSTGSTNLSGTYNYIGLHSNGALYMDEINIVWSQTAKEVTGISVSDSSGKSWSDGDTLSNTDLSVVVSYDNGESTTITDGTGVYFNSAHTQTTYTLSQGVNNIVVYYTEESGDADNSDNPLEITASAPKTLSSIAVTTPPTTTVYVEGSTFDKTGMFVTATYSDSSTANVTSECIFTPSEATLLTTDITSISISYTYKGHEETTSQAITVNEQKGTPTNPYTVAEAIDAIDAGTGVTSVYATGIVCQLGEYNSTYHNYTYVISSDGLTTSDQLTIYRGKDKDGANFTSEDDVQIGDTVVIYGNLIKYQTTYEFAQDNQRYSYSRSVEPRVRGISLPETLNVNLSASSSLTATVTKDEGATYELSWSKDSELISITGTGDTVTISAGSTVGSVTVTVSVVGTAFSANCVVSIVDPSDTIAGTYKLATAQSDIKTGKKVFIASVSDGEGSALSTTQNTNNRPATSVTVASEEVSISASEANIQIFKLEAYTVSSTSTFAFKGANGTENNKYIYAASSSSNHLKSYSTLDDNGKFSVSIASSGVATITAQGENTHNLLQYNSGSSLFSCYNGAQHSVYVYVQESDDDVTVSLDKSSATIDLGTATKTVQLTATVGPESLVDKSVSWSTSDPTVATVSDAGLVTGVGVGTATITVTTTVDSKTATCSITVVELASYTKISSVDQLWNGQKLLIAQSTESETLNIADHYNGSGNNLSATEVTQSSSVINLDTATNVFTLGQVIYDNDEDGTPDSMAWTLFDGTYYLYDAGTSSSNHLKGKTTLDSSCYWNIQYSEGSLTVRSVTNSAKPDLKYNSGSSLFSCYNGGQSAITLYVKDADTTGSSAAQAFTDTYMHMDQNVPGQCNTYYPIAKFAWSTLSESAQSKFLSEQTSAAARLSAWATAHGESFSISTGEFGAIVNPISILKKIDDSNTLIIIVIVSVISLTAIGGYFFLRKRREQN